MKVGIFQAIPKLKHYQMLTWLVAVIAVMTMSPVLSAANRTVELCTTIDGSESVVPGDFRLQLEGLASALLDKDTMPTDGSVTFSVVHFATDVRVEIPPTKIDSYDVAMELANKVLDIKQLELGWYTNIASGINTCAKQFNFNSQVQIIDIVTDGIHNQPGDPVASANAAVAMGVDAINTLAVGDLVDVNALRAMVRPQPAGSNLHEPGFFIHIPNYGVFADAIRAKIGAETGMHRPADYQSSMVNIGGGLCLTQVGDQLQVQNCNGGAQQQWALIGNYLLNPNGQCLTRSGNIITTSVCDLQNRGADQWWQLDGNKFTAPNQQCLTVVGDGLASGSRVSLETCDNKPTQRWNLSGTPLINIASERCLDVPDWSDNGKIVHTWDCHSNLNQRWILNGNKLINDHGRCLDVVAPVANQDGAQVQIWDCLSGENTANQNWSVNERGEIVNELGKCLDVDAGQLNINGGRVQTWGCSGQSNQQWQLFFKREYDGTIRGVVRDAVDSSAMAGVRADVVLNTVPVSNGFTGNDGNYNIGSVPTRQEISANFSRDGYIPARYNGINIQFGSSANLEPVLLVPNAYAGLGQITGLAVNDLSADGLEGVTLRLRAGINTKHGQVIAETVSGEGGAYNLQANGGNYTIEASRAGFVTNYVSVVVLGGEVRPNQHIGLTPVLGQGEIRVVLTWGQHPLDLDAHLTGPAADGGRFHVFWLPGQMGNVYGPPYAQLDVDDIFSYGPETITLSQSRLGGVYRYSVHDYTNRNQASSNGLARSGGQVRIYNEYGLLAVLNVPNKAGTLWTVFEIREGQLRLINEVSHESDSRSIRNSGYEENDLALINQFSK
jgi:hypothetical protein